MQYYSTATITQYIVFNAVSVLSTQSIYSLFLTLDKVTANMETEDGPRRSRCSRVRRPLSASGSSPAETFTFSLRFFFSSFFSPHDSAALRLTRRCTSTLCWFRCRTVVTELWVVVEGKGGGQKTLPLSFSLVVPQETQLLEERLLSGSLKFPEPAAELAQPLLLLCLSTSSLLCCLVSPLHPWSSAMRQARKALSADCPPSNQISCDGSV